MFNNKEKGIIGDIGLSLGSKIIAMVLFLVVDMVLVRILSFSEYNEWSYFYSITVIAYNLARVGINSSTKVHIAETSDQKKKKTYYWSGILLRIAISLACGLASLLLIAFSSKLGYPGKYPNLVNLIWILPMLIFFYTILDFYKEINIALINFKNIFIFSILEFGTCLVFTIAFNIKNASDIKVAQAYAIGYLMTVGIEILLTYKHFGKIKIEFKKVLLCVKPIIKFAFPMYLSNLVGALLVEMDTFMLGIFSTGQTGVYAIAKSLITKATNVNLAICVSTMTQFSVIEKKDISEKKKLFKKIMLLNGVIVVGVCIGVLVLGKTVITILYGSDYTNSGNVMNYLLVYYICYATSIFPSTFISYQKQADKILKYNIIMFLCNLCFNMLLIPKHGAVGAAIASSISIIPYTFFMFRGMKQIFDAIEKKD
ncbi:MAG: oligosaccharide flippase family protein [Lachnospiraceae bacterium]|nr:oligosaccharide flippase family protein [Lachnospiraceae bacterium]